MGTREGEGSEMRAYKFYFRHPSEGNKLIAMLPERRRDLQRVTEESVIKWVKQTIGSRADSRNIYYVEIEI
jgi:hypothetical protein